MLVPQHLQFAPPNGQDYEADDWRQLCKMMPIPLSKLPIYMLGGSHVPRFLPPLFHLGWTIERDKLTELVQHHFPEWVMYTLADHGDVHPDTGFNIVDGIIEEFCIPEDQHECVKIAQVFHTDGSVHLALSVGNNSVGILRPPMGMIQRIADKLLGGAQPLWYLDSRAWTWRRKVRVLSPEELRRWAARERAKQDLESSRVQTEAASDPA